MYPTSFTKNEFDLLIMKSSRCGYMNYQRVKCGRMIQKCKKNKYSDTFPKLCEGCSFEQGTYEETARI